MTNAAARDALAFLCAAGLLACDIPTAPPRFQPTFVIDAEPLTLPVTSTATSSFTSRDMADLDSDLLSRARGGVLVVRVENAIAATGSALVRVDGGGETVEMALDIMRADDRIQLSERQMRAFLSGAVMIRATGTLCPADGCASRPPPFPQIRLRPRLEILFEIGGR